MKYYNLIHNEEFFNLIGKYLNNKVYGVDAKEYFNHLIDNIKNTEKIIPVLGIQGAGKSSLLNAILMDDDILPTDVDETTCVPVEVRYGTDTKRAKVYFLDKDVREIEVSELEKYVHNDYNPANEMNVSKIVLYNDSEILRDNLVLVDLPGVGSLTPENQKTTLDYVEKLISAVFMIRTVPPITKTESNFINALWPKLTNTIFVQNKWNDESLEDAEDAREHNLKVLKTISRNHNEEKEIDINIVNVYEAVLGKYSKKEEIYKESGINFVINQLKNISINFNDELEKAIDRKAEDILKEISWKINENINIAKRKDKENEIEKEKKVDNAKRVLRENKKKIREAKDYCFEEVSNIKRKTRENIKVNIENMKTELRRVINGGIVDGEILNSIYVNEKEKAINIIMEEFTNDMISFSDELNKILGTIKVKGYNGEYKDTSTFFKDEAFKFEKFFYPLMGIGGGIAAGTTIGGIAGIPGIIIGAAIGAACSLIGNLLNKSVKNIRSKKTIEDINPVIIDLKKRLEEELINQLKHKEEYIEDMLDDYKEELQDKNKEDIKLINEQYSKLFEEEEIEKLKEDLKNVEGIMVK